MNTLFLRYQLDADGHAYQLLAVGDDTMALYPILDPLSLEHAIEIEGMILPQIVDLFETRGERFEGFEAFFARARRLQAGEADTGEALDEAQARALDRLRADITDWTPPEDVRRRALARFYQHAMCDNDGYRRKAHRSLEALVARLSEIHGAG